ncbi:MAG: FAD binding domain-containing protein [Actinobacteria bacterium]|nr:FAD binding domain-containing protein [Actinomycetota bacterium]
MSDLRIALPETIEEAVELLVDETAIAVGGGTSVGMMLKAGLLDVETLVDLGRLGLSGITQNADGTVSIGGTTTLREIANSPLSAPVLAHAAAVVGNPRVRSLATAGGAIVHGDPHQDLPPAVLALDGTVTLVSAEGTREVAISDFFVGFMETACREDELVTEIRLAPGDRRTAYARFNPASAEDYATVAVAAAVGLDSAGRIESARIALGGAGSTIVFVDEASTLLVGQTPDRELWRAAGDAAMRASDPSGDQRGSADYKRKMVGVFTERALAEALR